MSPEKLAAMANQIEKFFATQGEVDRAAAIADHLVKFWNPHMRRILLAHVDAGGADLDPLVVQAAERLRTIAS